MARWRRWFSRSYRRARRAEGAGDYRRAAGLYAEAGAGDEAAAALLFLAARATEPGARREALVDALRWLPEDHARHGEVRLRVARLDLDQLGGEGGAVSPGDRPRLAEAAAHLEEAGRLAEAARGYELLGRDDDAARCLTAAGEVERLEAILERRSREDARQWVERSAVERYAAAMAAGARVEAREALERATVAGAADPDLAVLLRELRGRWLRPGRVELRVEGVRLVLVGRLPASLGRAEADVPLRGGTVSRLHAELARAGDRVTVRDLGSKNGTRVAGVPVDGQAEVAGPAELALGDDLTLQVSLRGPAGLAATVTQGLDRGLRILLGPALWIPGLDAKVTFPGGVATLHPDPGAELRLDGRRCVTPVNLLGGDRLSLGGRTVEVVS